MEQPEKKIVFSWEEALNFEGESAPFIQYAHARTCGILNKCDKYEEYDHSLLKHTSEIPLVKKVADFPSLLDTCAKKRTTHPLANYTHELASLFNQFYRDCPVISAPNKELIAARFAIVKAVEICLKKSLNLLGVEAPDEM